MAGQDSNLSELVDAFVSGEDMDSVAFGDGEGKATASAVPEDSSDRTPDVENTPQESDFEMDLLVGSDTQVERTDKDPADKAPTSKETAKAESEESDEAATSELETITVTDHRGRRKVKVDLTDPAKIKKAYQQAYGMRKFQVERDQYKRELDDLRPQFEDKSETLNAIDQAYAENGIEGVVDLIEGEGAFQAALKASIDHKNWEAEATEAEIRAYERDKEMEKLRRQIKAQEESNSKFRETVSAEKEAVEKQALRAQLEPTFHKYRFDGKLGDSKLENKMDKMLWREARADLADYLSEGYELTPRIIERVFKDNYLLLKQSENKRVNDRTNQTIAKKKDEAIENVQSRVMSGIQTSNRAQEARELLDKGDLTKLLMDYAKWE